MTQDAQFERLAREIFEILPSAANLPSDVAKQMEIAALEALLKQLRNRVLDYIHSKRPQS